MRKIYNFDSVCQWLFKNKDKINAVRITSIKRYSFNDIEGNKFVCGLKVFTNEKYKNKLLQFDINTSYCDTDLPSITKEYLENYLYVCLGY